ncbi:hypothetical protein CLPU_10c01230 [Gottschalkia purinilytica]|uniref:Uncharacterized protein n=1 Tax=Gottschalkia purinilytica TaxID=1503 RepID=A0A0L0W939_GOTPU|nr:hypothetical protein [Gottschalkia purinilytica]KNF08068.1 hypothetical protein CLPU_10c01230 [Gottschalkia purinilytica]
MRCNECNIDQIIKINTPEKVKFECENGHTWYEDYIDNGGVHERPDSYKIEFEDTLFPSEKILYKKIIDEIDKNKNFYNSSNPEDITRTIIKKIGVSEKEIYKLFKKINEYKEIL